MGYPKKHRGRRKIGSKKEEQEKEIRKNNQFKFYERNSSNKKVEFMDISCSVVGNKPLFDYFSKPWNIWKHNFCRRPNW